MFVFQFEMLFCVEEPTDPAVMVVNSLLEKYPKVDATLFIGKSIGLHRYLANRLILLVSVQASSNCTIRCCVVTWSSGSHCCITMRAAVE